MATHLATPVDTVVRVYGNLQRWFDSCTYMVCMLVCFMNQVCIVRSDLQRCVGSIAALWMVGVLVVVVANCVVDGWYCC